MDSIARRCIRPAGASWLRNRIRNVSIRLASRVNSAVEVSNGVQLRLDSGSKQRADHVVLATGYKIEISRYPFLSKALTDQIQQVNGYPILLPGFECSVPGLHFLGAPAAWSFGPLMRFVSGTAYVGNALKFALEKAGNY
jgi:FAD-dependent urate hydroxylase